MESFLLKYYFQYILCFQPNIAVWDTGRTAAVPVNCIYKIQYIYIYIYAILYTVCILLSADHECESHWSYYCSSNPVVQRIISPEPGHMSHPTNWVFYIMCVFCSQLTTSVRVIGRTAAVPANRFSASSVRSLDTCPILPTAACFYGARRPGTRPVSADATTASCVLTGSHNSASFQNFIRIMDVG